MKEIKKNIKDTEKKKLTQKEAEKAKGGAGRITVLTAQAESIDNVGDIASMGSDLFE